MHISFQQLINYLEELLSREQITEVSLHLARCSECQRALVLAGQFLTNMRGSKPSRAGNRATSLPPYRRIMATGTPTYPPPTTFSSSVMR